MIDILKMGSSIFEFGLFGLLISTLIYARRLDRSIVRLRTDRAALRDLIEQIGSSITAAIAAADRLKDEASHGVAALDDACQAAAVSTRRLDELISTATLVSNQPTPVARVEGASSAEEIVALRPVAALGSVERNLVSSPRSAVSRRAQKPQSRAERDLARMLLDAS